MNTYNVSVNHLCEVKGEQDGEADKLRKYRAQTPTNI
jgi:hypothetical protein